MISDRYKKMPCLFVMFYKHWRILQLVWIPSIVLGWNVSADEYGNSVGGGDITCHRADGLGSDLDH